MTQKNKRGFIESRTVIIIIIVIFLALAVAGIISSSGKGESAIQKILNLFRFGS